MSREAVRRAVQRVRALLARVEAPLTALEHVAQAADAHIEALAPDFAALDASPFGGVQTFQTERISEQVNEPRVTRRLLEPTLAPAARVPGATQPAGASARSSTLAEAVSAAGRAQPAVRVLPASPRRQTSAARAESTAAARASRDDTVKTLTAPAGENGQSPEVTDLERVVSNAARTPGGQDREEREPVAQLGALANAALRVVRASREYAGRAGAAPATAPEREAPGFSKGAVLRAGASNLRPPTGQTPGSLPLQARARSAGEITVDAEVADAAGPQTPARATRAQFYFDPLEARPAADDAEDVLAERIGQLLREQARRQGVDLT